MKRDKQPDIRNLFYTATRSLPARPEAEGEKDRQYIEQFVLE
jgi:hypothetical protein